MSEPTKLTPEEARQMTEEIRRYESFIRRELPRLRAVLTNMASSLAAAAEGRDLDDPDFRAEVAAQVPETPLLAEMAISLLKGTAPTDAQLLEYCLSEEVIGDE